MLMSPLNSNGNVLLLIHRTADSPEYYDLLFAFCRLDVGGKLLTNHLKEIISYRLEHVLYGPLGANCFARVSAFPGN